MEAREFFERQLGTAGWAPVHHEAAMFLCSGVKNLHREFAVDQRNPQALRRFFPGTRIYWAQAAGFGVVPVLSRSPQFLAERMAWLGFEVAAVSEHPPSEVHHQGVVTAKTSTIDSLALQYAGVTTAESPRPCKSCGGLSSAQTCMPARRGELEGAPSRDYRPDLTWPRRCLSYQPTSIIPDSPSPSDYDRRTGRELWPEIEAVSSLQVDAESAMGKAVALLSDLLKAGARSAAEVLSAAEEVGISTRTAQRAAERLQVVKTKDGNGGWTWAMPEENGVTA